MKHSYILWCLLFCFCCTLRAQETVSSPRIGAQSSLSDSLSTPLGLCYPITPFLLSPMERLYAPALPFDTDFWQLHKGFNASLTLSATVGWGKGTPSGVGLGQDTAFLYALPLSSRFSVAGGLYTSHFNWGGFETNDVGFAALAAYRINEQFTAYVYGNKSFTSSFSRPRPLLLSGQGADRIGAMIDWHPTEMLNVQLRVERREYPHR